MNQKLPLLPIHLRPFQFHDLARSAQAAETSQREDQAPFAGWAGVEHFLGIFPRNEVIAGVVCSYRAVEIGEWILCDELATGCSAEELFGDAASAEDGVTCELLGVFEPQSPQIAVTLINAADVLVLAEVVGQVALGMAENQRRRRFHVGALGDIVFEEFAQPHTFGLGNQAGGRQAIGKHLPAFCHPAHHVVIGPAVVDRG